MICVIIFIDEVDSIAPKHEKTHRERCVFVCLFVYVLFVHARFARRCMRENKVSIFQLLTACSHACTCLSPGLEWEDTARTQTCALLLVVHKLDPTNAPTLVFILFVSSFLIVKRA